MTSPIVITRRSTSVALWLALGLNSLSALGQTPPTTSKPSTQPVGAEAGDALTPEAMVARMRQVESAPDLPDATRAKVLDLYKQAKEQLELAATYEARAVEFEKARVEAPEQLAHFKELLARRTTTQPASQPTTAPGVRPAPPTSAPASQPTADLTGKTLARLEQEMLSAETEWKSRQQTLGALADEAKARADRLAAIPEQIATQRKLLEKLLADLATPADTSNEISLAQRALAVARKRAVDREVKLYETESRSYEARSELLAVKRDLARLESREANRRFKQTQQAVIAQRKVDTERQQEQAKKELESAPPVIRNLAEQNLKLADDRATTTARGEAATQELKETKELIESYNDRLKLIQDQISASGLTNEIGQLLRLEKSRLADSRRYERLIVSRQAEVARSQLEELSLEAQRESLADLDDATNRTMRQIDAVYLAAHRVDLEKRIRTLLTTQREFLQTLRSTHEKYRRDLITLNAQQRQLVATLRAINQFIDENALWIRSMNPIYTARLPENWHETLALGWSVVMSTLFNDARRATPLYLLTALLLAVHLVLRRQMIARIARTADFVSKVYEDRFRLTLRVLTFTILLAAFWPLVLSFFGWRLTQALHGGAVAIISPTFDSFDAVESVALGLRRTAAAFFMLAMIQHVSRSRGLASMHFRWRIESVRCVRRGLIWLVPMALPSVFIIWACEATPDNAWRDAVGRVAFIVAMAALSLFLSRVLKPSSGIPAGYLERHRGGWIDDLKYVWYPAAVGIPLTLAVAACLGYYYTALQLEIHIMLTIRLSLALLFVNAIMIRYLQVTQRRIAIEQNRRKREAEEARAESAVAAAADEPPAVPIAEEAVDLAVVHSQTRRLVRSVMLLAVTFGLYAIWIDILPAFAFLNRIELWSHTVQVAETAAGGASVTKTEMIHITLAHAVLATIIASITVLLSRNLPGLLEVTILRRLPLTNAGRYAITTVSSYAVVVVGLVVAFGVIGVGWSQVQWLAAAITVGLGFGLQEIFANFVSGLIILFEQPVRVGDVITVGDKTGSVARIQLRATTIIDADRKELIIPNKEFVTSQILNWTLSDSVTRLSFRVGVARGTDTRSVERALLRCVEDVADVAAEPAPNAMFVDFGESVLNFQLQLYVRSIDARQRVQHEINQRIAQVFTAEGIEMAFPQRDIHIRSIPPSFEASRLGERLAGDGDGRSVR